MERDFHFFRYQKAILHYSKYGNGPKPIFCFHGFGLTGAMFSELEKILARDYTVYSFDLFFHGQSEWLSDEEAISEKFWSELITAFTKENNITSFSLLGFSIGARSVWSLANTLPEKINEIIAIAPDGVTNSGWYSLATGSKTTRFLFKTLLSKKEYINTLLNVGMAMMLMPRLTVRFAKCQLRTAKQRQKVYLTWVTYRKLKANTKSLAESINKLKIPITFYIGEQDKVIRKKSIHSLVKKLDNQNVILLKAGHLNLINAVIKYLE